MVAHNNDCNIWTLIYEFIEKLYCNNQITRKFKFMDFLFKQMCMPFNNKFIQSNKLLFITRRSFNYSIFYLLKKGLIYLK